MKPATFIAIVTAGVFSAVSFFPLAISQAAPTHEELRTVQSTPDPWSIIGQWHYACLDRRSMIDFHADGTFSCANDGESGKWKLSARDDHFILILKWNHSPEETAALISPTLFQGDTSKGEIIIRRL